MAKGAAPIRLLSTSFEEWVDDALWHRRGYNQSLWVWTTEDAVKLALRYTRGQVLHEGVTDLRALNRDIFALMTDTWMIKALIAERLRRICDAAPDRAAIASAVQLLGLLLEDALRIKNQAPSGEPNRDVLRALDDLPYRNPITEAWELLQVQALYEAAGDLLENAYVDEATTLASSAGLEAIAAQVDDASAAALAARIRLNQEDRAFGQVLTQQYPAIPRIKTLSDW